MEMKFKTVRLCAGDAFSVIPQEPVRFDLDQAAAILERYGMDIINPGVMIIARQNDVEMTIYTNGRLLIRPIRNREEAESIAIEIYRRLKDARTEQSSTPS
ncbi:MAG: hypothetical protein QHH00_03105 [Methanomassiliicoccales archaeon]|jgi:TATA-box binding protein (TBP) (component of TFIID and TFIIIB)|nr:hypothetical protein [Methanomassiliicoccales archaeon]